MRKELHELLSSDDDLLAILTGGFFYRQGIDRKKTPEAYDADGMIKPCGVLAMHPIVKRSPFKHSAEQYFQIFFYEQSGYENIDAAKERVYDLLHGESVELDQGFNYEIEHANDLGNSEDPVLNCSMDFSRYRAILLRR